MAKLKEALYTLVQHSGYAVVGNVDFIRGVHEIMISTDAELRKVQEAGGLVFDNFKDADDRAYHEMYYGKDTGLIPLASGSFSRKKLDGLRIYIPES